MSSPILYGEQRYRGVHILIQSALLKSTAAGQAARSYTVLKLMEVALSSASGAVISMTPCFGPDCTVASSTTRLKGTLLGTLVRRPNLRRP